MRTRRHRADRGVRAGRWCAALAALLVLPASSVRLEPARPAATFVVVQMNLCNSGLAPSCYSSGRAVDEAAAKIRQHAPDLVTVQEICRADLYGRDGRGGLVEPLADRYGSEHVSVGFVPALDRDTGDWYRCTSGEPFGVAVIHHGDRHELHHGRYASQDATDEVRVWACTTVVTGRRTGCTTHLSTDPGVAARQCRELMSVLRSPWVLPEVVVAGDLNLSSGRGDPHGVDDCLPAAYERRSDHAVQHILFTRTLRWAGGGAEDLRWTDHPLLYGAFHL
jgi:endonuclease/exonuclease/phosphatase family metal-dependent hydrolase